MAEVLLEAAAVSGARLPLTCVVCGDAASGYDRHNFYAPAWWFYLAVWIGLYIAYVLIALAIAVKVWPLARSQAQVPLCVLHRNHWRWRKQVIWGTSVVTILVIFACVAMFNLGFDSRLSQEATDRLMLLIVPAAILLLVAPTALLLAHLWLKYSTVHARSIRGGEILLANVAPEFVEAVRIERERSGSSS